MSPVAAFHTGQPVFRLRGDESLEWEHGPRLLDMTPMRIKKVESCREVGDMPTVTVTFYGVLTTEQ